MALEIRSIPVLTGETAERFEKMANQHENNGKKLQFSQEYALSVEKMQRRSIDFLKEHNGTIKYN